MSRKRKFSFGGAFSQASAPGTAHVKYSPVMAIDLVEQAENSRNINVKAHCITYMKEYENKSLEELRLEDYTAGRKGTLSGGGFAAQTQEARSSYSGSSRAFGQASAPGTAHVKYRPVMAIEVVEQGENSRYINVKAHCITHIKEYRNKSLEELRLEDYTVGRKGTPSEGGIAAQTQEARSSYSGSSRAFGQASAPGTARVKYSPVMAIEVVEQGENSRYINIKAHCITHMKEYRNKSLEELRLEDYTAGRKWTPSEGGIAAQTQEARSSYSESICTEPVVEEENSDGDEGDGDEGDSGDEIYELSCDSDESSSESYESRRRSESRSSETPRTIGPGGVPSNLPPLTFHSVHGEDISISRDGSIARIVGGNGIAFSARPVKVDEKVCLHFVETPYQWCVLFIFGFTSHNPASLAHSLPEYASDLIDKPGIWAAYGGFKKDNIFDFYVNSAGDVHFSINGKNKGLFLTGVDTKKPLWALVYLFRSGITVQFIDPIYFPSKSMANPLQPLSLHMTKGRNVQFVSHSGVAARVDAKIGQGYVFTAQPMRPGQTIIVQVLSTESAHDGSLSFGLTSCDPASLSPSDLHADAELLLDRPEYWVVRRDAAHGFGRGDELAVTLTMDGEVTVSRNGSTPVTVMHVDHTVELWAFVDIDGAIQKLRMLTTPQAVTSPPPPEQPKMLTGTAAPLAGVGEPIRASSQPCPAGKQQPAEGNSTETECTICFDNPIDSALCNCGHMCMCHSCALKQWKGRGNGQCPICRAEIINVLRLYKP